MGTELAGLDLEGRVESYWEALSWPVILARPADLPSPSPHPDSACCRCRRERKERTLDLNLVVALSPHDPALLRTCCSAACRRERKERTLDVISNNAAEFELWFWGTQVRHA